MRAVLDKNLDSKFFEHNSNYPVVGEVARHLVKVARIRVDEKVKVLNGRGDIFFCHVSQVEKKVVHLEFEKMAHEGHRSGIHLFIGRPKKEAFEDIIRSCVELGVEKIIPLQSEFSQQFNLAQERLDRIVESALIQSNNPWIPKIEDTISFNQLKMVISDYDQVVFYDSKSDGSSKRTFGPSLSGGPLGYIVGPEGGFSSEEINELRSLDRVHFYHLSTQIMRSQTAVICCFGHLLSHRAGMMEKNN